MVVSIDASKETRSQIKPTPIIVEALDGVSIDSLTCANHAIMAVVGLRNERELKFLSFNPPIIKAASLEKLVDWLIREHRGPTDVFDYHFFLTLQTFSSPEEVLGLLQNRIRENPQIETRAIGVVYKWMRKRPKDFGESKVIEMVMSMVPASSELKLAIDKQISRLACLQQSKNTNLR